MHKLPLKVGGYVIGDMLPETLEVLVLERVWELATKLANRLFRGNSQLTEGKYAWWNAKFSVGFPRNSFEKFPMNIYSGHSEAWP